MSAMTNELANSLAIDPAAASTTPLVALDEVHTYYGKSHILHGVSLTVAPGEVVGLLGRNGVGKSTTLKTIMGLVRPSRGSVWLEGRAIAGLPPHKLARRGIGYVPEDRRIFSDLTVNENLDVGRQARRGGQQSAPRWTPEQLFEIFPNLRELRSRLGGRMSGGEQQMLAIARTFDGQSVIGPARRAIRRIGAENRRTDDRGDPSDEEARLEPAAERTECSLRAADRRPRLRH